MMRATKSNRQARRRGGALIMALLVVLVLTIVGLAVAYFTQLEDQSSGNIRLSKTAFYAAETGLRTGERALTTANAGGIFASDLLSYAGTVANPRVPLPGGGFEGVPLVVNNVPYRRVILPSAPGTSDVAVFSLYVRNNIEDRGNAVVPPTDDDDILNLIAIGQVFTSVAAVANGNPIATKILEEQIVLATPGTEENAQEGQDQAGTGTGQTGR
ncbi:hypothetical protein EG835_07770 [bacterium]|nr:hypothetical protein [bacterium]